MEVRLVSHLHDKSIDAIVVNLRDINDQRRLDMIKGEFVSLAAHQLRTPLAVIRWYSEDLKNKYKSASTSAGEKVVKKKIKEIYAAGVRMNDIINHLLEVSSMELRTIKIQVSIINLNNIVQKVINNHLAMIKRKKLKVIFEPVQLPDIIGDERLIEIILSNLLSNATKYTPIEGTILISLLPNKNNILFKIKDSGIGIPKTEKDKIFTKLHRSQNAKQIDSGGLGLGLYLVKLIINLKGGKIWYKSKLGEGTTFFVEFPKRIKTIK
jgi:signal transduction histidine kinase